MKNKSVRTEIFEGPFGRKRAGFSLRMAPMIDMIFLLLIFFLIAAKWRPEENFLPFQLPAAQAQPLRIVKPEPLSIYIYSADGGCQIQIGQIYTVEIKNETIEADMVILMEKIGECLTAQKRFATDPVEIVCEPQVKWEYLAKIYNIFFGAGLTDITFAITE